MIIAVINSEYLDRNPEYNKDNNKGSRYGAPSHPHFPKSAMGTKIKTRGWSKISNLQSQGQMPYKEKSLLDEFKKIQARCKDKGISHFNLLLIQLKICIKKFLSRNI